MPTIDELQESLKITEAAHRALQDFAAEDRAQAAWFHRIAIELARPPRGIGKWLPFWIVRRLLQRRLKRAKLFDAGHYLACYPDLAVSRKDPLHHFLRHGLSEGRGIGASFHAMPLAEPDARTVHAILESGLFDPKWYSETYRVEGSPQTLLEDYLDKSRSELRDPGPLFSGGFYRVENPDTRYINPLEHYVGKGMKEGRRAFNASIADKFMSAQPQARLTSIFEMIDLEKRVVVLHWDRGNFFFTDIARYVVEELTNAGAHAAISSDHREIDLDGAEVVIIAPHEYCVHGPGRDLSETVARRVIHINTEQWQTSWFSLALGEMLRSRRVLDLNPQSARGLKALGIEAGFLPLLPRPGGVFDFSRPLSSRVSKFRAIKSLTYPDRFVDRPYDLLFAGALNERRSGKLASLAPVLSRYDCFIHAPAIKGPMMPDNPNIIDGNDLAQIAKNSKILLNVHQGDSHYFEWHRLIVSGIAQGCVPITEPCASIGIVRPGDHYISVPIDEMAARIDWLLGTTEGEQELIRIHENGRQLMADLSQDERF